MSNFLIGCCLALSAHLIAAISQIFLKIAAGKEYSVWWRSYINPLVIIAYGFFFGTTLINVFALRYIPLSFSAGLGASGQIFVPVLSMLFLKEKISRKRQLGMLIIVIGIIIFSL